MKKILILLLGATLSLSTSAASVWSKFRDIDDIYTYNSKDTLHVYLSGISCPNAKNYFTISPDQADNAKQLISMILAAKMAKSQVNVYYDATINNTYCYFKGLRIKN